MDERKVLINVFITDDDMRALVRIRNYFGENGKTQLEHIAYDVLDRVVKPFIQTIEQTPIPPTGATIKININSPGLPLTVI